MAGTIKVNFSTGRVIKRNRLVTSKAFKNVASKTAAFQAWAISEKGYGSAPRYRQGIGRRPENHDCYTGLRRVSRPGLPALSVR
jgi:hypothetical protein